MSLGYIGFCRKIDEDIFSAVYEYSGENWNDRRSTHGDARLFDGVFVIDKCCLEEPALVPSTFRAASGAEWDITGRALHSPKINKHIVEGNIKILRECKNAFRRNDRETTDYIAGKLLHTIFIQYQKEGKMPDTAAFIR